MQLSVRKLLLLSLNLASTLLTLFSGLRENPIIVFVTGRYDLARAHMIEGAINYDIVRDDLIKIDKLTNLMAVGERYRFISAPRRSPDNLAEDRSTCIRVNSMNATMMTTNYNDFWGTGPRRTQIFLYNISTPHCKIANFRPEWYEKDCIDKQFRRSARNRVIQVGVERDFGEPGVPFLKCLGRPERTFQYMTDLMVHKSFWAGGSFHVELQSSKCLAVPLIRNPDWKWGLFQVEPVDHAATVVAAIDNSGWVTELIGVLYGIVSISTIVQGIFAAVVQSTAVYYVPDKLRLLREKKKSSNVWMNHWLYITLSILDSLLNLRMMYMVLEMGTWMLGKKVNLENFIFMCGALTRTTWIVCALHSLVRMMLKIVIRGMESLKVVRASIQERMEWYVDAYSLFLSYKAYSILLCTLLFLFLQIHGGTSFMERQNPFPNEGIFGGSPNIAQFWSNEIICDLTVILAILMLAGILLGSALSMTKYKHVASNNVIKLLQQRYILVGWDVFVAMEALGIDPFNPTLVINDAATTNCSFGAVI